MRTEDGHIVFECLEGDSAAFGLLVDKYKGSIFALAYTKLGNFHDAEDVTQEVFIKAYRKLKTLRNRDNFLAWLYAITSNLCKDWLRSRERRLDHETIEEKTIGRLSMESYRNNKNYESLHDALDSLPDSYRQVLVLHYLGGMDGKEIARFLGTSQNAILLRLSRARSQLREEMVTMMRDTYAAQRLPVTFTFRIVEIVKRISLNPVPSAPWISWGVTLTAGLVFIILSLNSPQISLNSLKAFSELSGRIGVVDTELYPVINQQSYEPSMNAGIPIELIMGSKGLKGDALAGSGKGDESKTETPSQTNIPAITGKVEMQTVSGKVLRDESPVPKAQVYIYDHDTGTRYENITSSEGSFNIEIPKPETDWKWERLSAIAILPGYSFNWSKIDKNDTSNIIIKLQKPASVTGTIGDESGKPIQDAEARITDLSLPIGEWLIGEAVPSYSVAKSDAEGNFAFHSFPTGSIVNINIIGKGYAKQRKYSVQVGTEGITFKLKPEARIEGKVTFGDTGRPAKGIKISVRGIYPTDGFADAITDDNGHYVIANLDAGQYDVMLSDINDWTAVAKEFMKINKGETANNVDLKLIKGSIITGKALDKDTNEPLAGRSIAIYDSARPEPQGSVQSYSTDKDGSFHFRVAPGKAKVYDQGYQGSPQVYELVGQNSVMIDVVEGMDISDVNLYFQKVETLNVKGSVFNIDGDPISGVVITDAAEWYRQLAVSDKDGKFTISGLKQGKKLAIKAEQKEMKLRGIAEMDVQSNDDELEIIMEEYETTSVTGRVVNQKGEIIPSANIGIVKWEGSSGIGTSAGMADGSGQYKINNLIVEGEYYVNADAEGYRGASSERFIATKDMKPLPDIVLNTAGKYFLEGIVRDESGNPISGARVGARSTQASTNTDENGYYKIENLDNVVEIEVNINHSDYGYNTFRYVTTNEKHDFVLVKADGYLSGKVVDAGGNPIDTALVSIESGLPSDFESSGHVNVGTRTDNNGRFQLSHLLINKKADIYVGKDRLYKVFKDVEMNRDDVLFTLKEESAEPPKPPTAEDTAKWKYREEINKRAKEIAGKPSPELDVEQWIAGKPVDLSKLRSKVVVLYFWSYFREVDNKSVEDKKSLETIGFLNVLQKAYFDKGVVFVSIHAYTQKIDELKNAIKGWNPVYSIGIDKKSPIKWAKGVTFDKFASDWPPFLLIDRDGIVKYQAWDSELERKIQELVSE